MNLNKTCDWFKLYFYDLFVLQEYSLDINHDIRYTFYIATFIKSACIFLVFQLLSLLQCLAPLVSHLSHAWPIFDDWEKWWPKRTPWLPYNAVLYLVVVSEVMLYQGTVHQYVCNEDESVTGQRYSDFSLHCGFEMGEVMDTFVSFQTVNK